MAHSAVVVNSSSLLVDVALFGESSIGNTTLLKFSKFLEIFF